MDAFPEFVQEKRDERRTALHAAVALTGWETVRFQLGDEPEPEGSSSDFSTAAFAP